MWSYRRCCWNHIRGCWFSSIRQHSIQGVYVFLLVSTATMLYAYYRFSTAATNDVARSETIVVVVNASIQHVKVTSHHKNDTAVASSLIHPPTPPLTRARLSSSNLSFSTTTTLSPTSHTSTSSPLSTTSSTKSISRALSPSPLPLTTNSTLNVDRFVSFSGGFADGRGLGNQMFDLAAVVYVAELTGRQPGILKFNYKLGLDEVFDMQIRRFDNLCPCYVFGEQESLQYDSRLEDLVNGSRAKDARGKSIFLSGFFQSWKYTQNVERRLRQHFTFLPEIRQFVDKFLAESRPPGWLAGYVRVGIHARRGDVLNADKIKFGYTTPDELYFARAMRYFIDRFYRVQFIVFSIDIDWCRKNLAEFAVKLRHRVNVTFVTPHSRGEDFAILASCEHVIMSTGTYGWWAAWLAHGITIYYADWPKNGSALASKFRRDDFFPPTWIGMT